MQNRSDPRRGGKRRSDQQGMPTFTIWVPPGVSPITSTGVEVRQMMRRSVSEADRAVERPGATRAAKRSHSWSQPSPELEGAQPPAMEEEAWRSRKRKRRAEEPRPSWESERRTEEPRAERNGASRRDETKRAQESKPGGIDWRSPSSLRRQLVVPPTRTAALTTQPGLQVPPPSIPSAGWKIPERWTDLADSPWEKGDSDSADMYVPPEVEAAAQVVMAQYDMQVSGMTLITTKPDKGGAIWRIETDKGPRSLKLLHRPPERSLFSIGAQDYLVKQGARVAPLVATRSGDLYVVNEGRIWMVTDWIEGLQQATKVDLEGAQALCYGLGEFHKLSQGYVPPPGAKKASRLYRWPKTYQKILNKIDWFRQIARAYSEMPASATLLSVCDQFEQQARDALARLEASPYAQLVARGEPAWGIVHQDYGWSNGQIGPGGIWIIDLDGVAYDLPIRDLRKLITSTMDDMGVWDVSWMRGMIDAYNQANPIEPELYQVLLIDMALPNEFYKHVKECVMEPEQFLNGELEALLQRLVEVDRTKWQALAELGLGPLPGTEQRRKGGSA